MKPNLNLMGHKGWRFIFQGAVGGCLSALVVGVIFITLIGIFAAINDPGEVQRQAAELLLALGFGLFVFLLFSSVPAISGGIGLAIWLRHDFMKGILLPAEAFWKGLLIGSVGGFLACTAVSFLYWYPGSSVIEDITYSSVITVLAALSGGLTAHKLATFILSSAPVQVSESPGEQ